MPERLAAKILDVLRQVAPGMPLRDGLDRIIQGSKGALIVVGDGPNVLSICSGGFLLDAAYSPQRLQELSKMDGAIILAADASRIARANVHLVPDPSVPTSETGTRHRTAERVARSIDVPVIELMTENEAVTNTGPQPPEHDVGMGRHRLYEVAGLTHGDSLQRGGLRPAMAQLQRKGLWSPPPPDS